MDDDWRDWKNGRYDNRYRGVRRHSGQRNKKKAISIAFLCIVAVGIVYFISANHDIFSSNSITLPTQISKIVNNTVGNTVTSIQKNPIIKNATSKLPTLSPQISKIVNTTIAITTPIRNTIVNNTISSVPSTNPITNTNDQNTVQTPSLQDLYTYALNIVNEDRKANGLSPVALSTVSSAQNHADDQLSLSYFSHWDSDGVKPYVIYTKLGGRGSVAENNYYTYSTCPTSDCIENTYDPYAEIKNGENDMMNNDAASNWGHRNNILDPHHTHVNFGIAYNHDRFYFVENFEDNLVSWQTLKLVGTTLIMTGTMPRGYTMDHIDVFSDPSPKTLTGYDLDNLPPYNAGYYDQGSDVGMIMPKLTGGYYYPECATGKTTVTSSDGSTQCLDYTTYENNSANPSGVDVSADVSKWVGSPGLHTIYVNLKDANGNLVQSTSLTLEYLK